MSKIYSIEGILLDKFKRYISISLFLYILFQLHSNDLDTNLNILKVFIPITIIILYLLNHRIINKKISNLKMITKSELGEKYLKLKKTYNDNYIFKLSLIFVLVGSIFIITPVYDYINKYYETLDFKETEGTISIKIIKHTKGDKIHLNYEYFVDNIKYYNEKFSNGVGDIYDFVEQYPERNKFPVYYDINDPSKSVLVIGGRKNFYNAANISGFIILLLGIIGFQTSKSTLCKNIWESLFGYI